MTSGLPVNGLVGLVGIPRRPRLLERNRGNAHPPRLTEFFGNVRGLSPSSTRVAPVPYIVRPTPPPPAGRPLPGPEYDRVAPSRNRISAKSHMVRGRRLYRFRSAVFRPWSRLVIEAANANGAACRASSTNPAKPAMPGPPSARRPTVHPTRRKPFRPRLPERPPHCPSTWAQHHTAGSTRNLLSASPRRAGWECGTTKSSTTAEGSPHAGCK